MNTSSSLTNSLSQFEFQIDSVDVSNNNNNITNDNLNFNEEQIYTFDSSKGSFKIIFPQEASSNSYSTQVPSEPVSTNALNPQNLYDLLLKLKQTDQLKLDANSPHLTSQFYLKQSEVDLLLNNCNTTSNVSGSLETSSASMITNDLNENDLNSLNDLELPSLTQANTFECQELCCLLKFVALDEF